LLPLSSLLPRIPSPPLLLPPLHTSPTYASAPLGYRAAMSDIPEAEMPPRKRVCFTAPTRRFEVRESSTAVAARQTGHTVARRVDYGFIDTLDASIRASEGRVMTVVGEVNERVTDLATTQRQDAHELYVCCEDTRRPSIVESSYLLTDEKERGRRQKMTPKKKPTPMTDATIKQLISQGVVDALAEYEATRNSGNGDDSHDSNSHVKTFGHDAAYEMTWKTLRKMTTDKYCPRSEIKKLEMEIWNLKVKGTDVMSSTQRFQELKLMCRRIQKTMQDVVEFANYLTYQKICTFAERQAEDKRKHDDNSRNNHTQQQPYKRRNIARAYTVGPGEKREYGRSLPLCIKCNYYHNGQYASKCNNCKKVGHLARDCRSLAATANNPPGRIRGLSLDLNVEFRGITRNISLS
ncbi:reverse transcriptase domain-containing protein, partial [Tanacetum coccineum]